jgi:hypothetical protein
MTLTNTQRNNLNTKVQIEGMAYHNLDGTIGWTNRFIHMGGGVGAQLVNSGYIDMYFPAAAIPVRGGAARALVAATAGETQRLGGVLLNAWESLVYHYQPQSANTSNPAAFEIMYYTPQGYDAENTIVLAQRDGSQKITWFNGTVTEPGHQFAGDGAITASTWASMKQRVSASGYAFSPGGNTGVPTAFGFTGQIRWIDGGQSPYLTGNGYVDCTQTTHAVIGTPVIGVGSASRAWRAMTAAEKPAWFGGALRGNFPIVPASTPVVDLNDNETLFFVPRIDTGGAGATVGTWYVAGYTSPAIAPHWLPIVSRQNTGANATLQLLVGGSGQTTLRAGDAKWQFSNEAALDRLHRKATQKGLKHCRWTQAGFFAGAGANGLLGSAEGVLVSWQDNTAIWGISDGYASWGVQYSYINVPSVGSQIPVVNPGSNITRTVQSIGGRRYVPLGNWESLYWIPPAYIGGTSSVDGDFVIGYYANNHLIPMGAVLVAHAEGAVFVGGTSVNKTRVRFVDGTYIQPGSSLAVGTPTINDHAEGTGDWKSMVVAGQTPPAGTAPVPAVAGVLGNYAAPWTSFYFQRTLDDDPRGELKLEGLLNLGTNITAVTPLIAFMPGVQVRGQPIIPVAVTATTLADSQLIMGELRFINAVVGGQSGIGIYAQSSSFNTTVNPEFTLGTNGNGKAAGALLWVSLNNITIPLA